MRPLKIFKEAVLDPFAEFFKRERPFIILGFILLYKVGDMMASNMTMPFYLEMGFTKSQIAGVTKIFGLWAVLGGTFLGGVLLFRWSIGKCLFFFGILQAVSTAGFAALSSYGAASLSFLAGVIAFENISGGMGTAAYTAYMASETNKKFTATQLALLTSFMGVPRTFLAAPTGYMAEGMGWSPFFIFCTLIAIPGLVLLHYLSPKS